MRSTKKLSMMVVCVGGGVSRTSAIRGATKPNMTSMTQPMPRSCLADLLVASGAMISSLFPRLATRRSSRITTWSFSSAFLVCGLASSTMAAAPYSRGVATATPGMASARIRGYKLDDEVDRRANENPLRTSSVIVTLVPGAQLPPEFRAYARGGKLDLINGHVLEVSNGLLMTLAAHPNIFRIHDNRPIATHNFRTSMTVGAPTARATLGLSGAGIGVAVIDSGITAWHDDLTVGSSTTVYPYGNQRVTKFVDFVNGQSLPYDDNGHGSHVAGIIAGNGYDSVGQKAGIAPGASVISLKVLDANGAGTIGSVIAALNWVAANAGAYNIRVVNLSVGAAIRESFWTDPLTLAAKALTDRGISVVTAAGNLGQNAAGQLQYGGITAPGNAPWVLTVGASSTMGTIVRADDTMANYSSAGPTFIDYLAKPDLVAPGTGTVSLAVPGSTFYATKARYLLNGSIALGSMPYLSLSGTSMAAPVVSGTIALMLQANPTLTPNLIKAILQYTAEVYPGYSLLRQGAGFLNTLGAVQLAAFYATAKVGDRMLVEKAWSRHIHWGNQRLSGGYLTPTANAWATNIVWGTAKTLGTSGDNIVWGTLCGVCDSIVWGTSILDRLAWGTAIKGDNIVWGTAAGAANIVWGTDCGGADCDHVVWGRVDEADNRVWGTAIKGDNIVWGTAGRDNIVWGTGGRDNIVWGTSAFDIDVMWSRDRPDAIVYPDEAETPDVTPAVGDLGLTPDTLTPLTRTATARGVPLRPTITTTTIGHSTGGM